MLTGKEYNVVYYYVKYSIQSHAVAKTLATQVKTCVPNKVGVIKSQTVVNLVMPAPFALATPLPRCWVSVAEKIILSLHKHFVPYLL